MNERETTKASSPWACRRTVFKMGDDTLYLLKTETKKLEVPPPPKKRKQTKKQQKNLSMLVSDGGVNEEDVEALVNKGLTSPGDTNDGRKASPSSVVACSCFLLTSLLQQPYCRRSPPAGLNHYKRPERQLSLSFCFSWRNSFRLPVPPP